MLDQELHALLSEALTEACQKILDTMSGHGYTCSLVLGAQENILLCAKQDSSFTFHFHWTPRPWIDITYSIGGRP